MTSRRALLLGEAEPWLATIAKRMEQDGFLAATGRFVYSEAFRSQLPPSALVLAPPSRPGRGQDALDAAAMVAALDESLITAGLVVRDLVARHAVADTRIVVLTDWAARGLAEAGAAGAVGAGMIGLARSWSLELAPLGATANVILTGPLPEDPRMPRPDALVAHPDVAAVAHAVAFFCDPLALPITGQVLAVCGGRSAGSMPP
ncbi:SDR family oxidoreductase [Sabulicella rubraurantiaca]|uniref:SDR family oxidoreductase n=1 Tax=Sabulicella rubraurantiaca TaxID=2811429 RepID=UPI001A9586FE|nr:SDR family oxidoreductase [Sabulicella rubraurantiaca]